MRFLFGFILGLAIGYALASTLSGQNVVLSRHRAQSVPAA
jgi:hypothetical protein